MGRKTSRSWLCLAGATWWLALVAATAGCEHGTETPPPDLAPEPVDEDDVGATSTDAKDGSDRPAYECAISGREVICDEGVIINGDRLLTPVNRDNALVSTYSPVVVRVPSHYLSGDGERLRLLALGHFIALSDLARQDLGQTLLAGSGYREFGTQCCLFDYYAYSNGLVWAEASSAHAGHSEHQLGTTVDIVRGDGAFLSTGDTGIMSWLAAHAHEYGFVMSYPEGSQGITGYKHEPWHWRFVGVAAATRLRARSTELGRQLSTHEFVNTLTTADRDQLEQPGAGDAAMIDLALLALCQELGGISTCAGDDHLIECGAAPAFVACRCAAQPAGTPDRCSGDPTDAFCVGRSDGSVCDDDELVQCTGGNVAAREPCTYGCDSAASPDACVEAPVSFCTGQGDGDYCDGSDLVRCVAGAVSTRTPCPDGCEPQPTGVDDRCAEASTDYCDGRDDGLHCDGDDLVECRAGLTVARDTCAAGCEVRPPGEADRCVCGAAGQPCCEGAVCLDGSGCEAGLCGASCIDEWYECDPDGVECCGGQCCDCTATCGFHMCKDADFSCANTCVNAC